MDYDYGRYAKTYDLEYGTLREDIPFYVELAKRTGGPALELAVGTGRVALEIARAGVEVHGLDVTDEMLAVARGKLAAEPGLPLTLHHADMRTADLTAHGPFRLVYVPARAFLHMLTVEDQLAALANVRRHLAPDGLFAGNVFFPRYDILVRNMEAASPWRREDEYDHPETGNRIHVDFMVRAHPKTQLIEVRNRSDEIGPDGRVVETSYRELTLTWIHPRELEHLFWRGGFEIVDLFGDFEGTPLSQGGDEMVFVARIRND